MLRNKKVSFLLWLATVFGSAGLLSAIGVDANTIASICVTLFILLLIVAVIIIARLSSTMSAGVFSIFALIAYILRPNISRQNRPGPGEIPTEYYKFISSDFLNVLIALCLLAASGWLAISIIWYSRMMIIHLVRIKETTAKEEN